MDGNSDMKHYDRVTRFAEEAGRMEEDKKNRILSDTEKYNLSLDNSKSDYTEIKFPVLLTWNSSVTVRFMVPSTMVNAEDQDFMDYDSSKRIFARYFREHICPWYEGVTLSELLISSYIGKEEYYDIVRNGLPPWEDSVHKTLPEESAERIAENFSAAGRIRKISDDSLRVGYVIKELGIRKTAFEDILSSVEQKLYNGGTFTKQESKFADSLLRFDSKNMFPINMTEKQITGAVIQAYTTAKPVPANEICHEDVMKSRFGETCGNLLFEGASDGLPVRFWYDIDEGIIESAYPIN